MNSYVLRRVRCDVHLRLGHRCQRAAHGAAHKVAGTRSGFQPALAFQMAAELHRSGQADVVLAHQTAQ